MAFSLSTAGKNAEAGATAALANSGTLVLYSGTAPANASAALSGNTVLATVTFGATAFGAASSGTVTANALTSGSAVATGTATFYRIFKSDGTTVVAQGDIADLALVNTSIVTSETVSLAALTYTRS